MVSNALQNVEEWVSKSNLSSKIQHVTCAVFCPPRSSNGTITFSYSDRYGYEGAAWQLHSHALCIYLVDMWSRYTDCIYTFWQGPIYLEIWARSVPFRNSCVLMYFVWYSILSWSLCRSTSKRLIIDSIWHWSIIEEGWARVSPHRYCAHLANRMVTVHTTITSTQQSSLHAPCFALHRTSAKNSHRTNTC